MTIALRDPTQAVSSRLKRIDLDISVAGQKIHQSFAPNGQTTYSFLWDGRDALNRVVQGQQQATAKVSYVYPAVFLEAAPYQEAFGTASQSGVPIGTNRETTEVSFTRQMERVLGHFQPVAQGFGGWTLSGHHTYDPQAKVLYLGDGRRRSATNTQNTLRKIGNDLYRRVVSGRDGNLYGASISDHDWPYEVRRIEADGTSTLVATFPNFIGDIAVGIDSTIYATVYNGDLPRLIYAKKPTEQPVRIAGEDFFNYGVPFANQEGDPSSVRFSHLSGLDVDHNGNLIFSDHGLHRVYRLSVATARYWTVAGDGTYGSNCNASGNQATSVPACQPSAVVVAPSGAIYFWDTVGVIRRVSPAGQVTHFAGTQTGSEVDGIAAIEAKIEGNVRLAVGSDETVYLTTSTGNRVRYVGNNGVIRTIAGSIAPTQPVPSSNQKIALEAKLNLPLGVAVRSDGEVYFISDSTISWSQHYGELLAVRSSYPGIALTDVSVASEDGQELFVFDAEGRHKFTKSVRTGQYKRSFAYINKLLTSITDEYGNTTQIHRGVGPNSTGINIESPYGQVTLLTFDAAAGGYLASVTNPAGEAYSFKYNDQTGLLEEFTNPRGYKNTFVYDAVGRLIKEEDPATSSLPGSFYDISRTDIPGGWRVDLTTGEGRTTSYAIEAKADGTEERRVTDPANLTSKSERKGTTTKVTKPDGTVITTTLSPDPRFGMQAPLTSITTTLPDGVTVRTEERSRTINYDANNSSQVLSEVETVKVNGNKEYNTTYNPANQTLTTVTPMGRTHTTVFDAHGRPLTSSAPGASAVSFLYDTRGRLESSTQGQRKTALSYAPGKPFVGSITQLFGQQAIESTSFEHDLVGRIKKETYTNGEDTDFSYDEMGNLLTLTPPGKPAHGMEYSSVDLLSDYNPPAVSSTGSTTYDYNLDRQPTKERRWEGTTVRVMVERTYDNAGRLEYVGWPLGSSSTSLMYAYDVTTGQLDSVTGPGAQEVAYSYNGPLLTGQTWSGLSAGSVSFEHNNDFLVVKELVNGGSGIEYVYDNDGLVTKLKVLNTNTLLDLTREQTTGRVESADTGSVHEAWTYDSIYGEQESYTVTTGSITLYAVSYLRDGLGRIERKTETRNGTATVWAYHYDARGRLDNVTKNPDGPTPVVATYTYDGNGNRTSASVPWPTQSIVTAADTTYDDQDRLITYGGLSFTYRANGELSTKTETNVTTTYDYDPLGNLRSVEAPGLSVAYTVDGQSRRMTRKLSGITTHQWLYSNQLHIVAELNASGILVSRFAYLPGSHSPDLVIQGSTIYRIVKDQVGSVVMVVNTATGTVAQAKEYDAWGVVLSDSQPGFQPFGFAGGLTDGATGLVRFGARDYDPRVGRWTSKDPIRFGGGDSLLYGYVEGDPINYVDQSGLVPFNIGGIDAWMHARQWLKDAAEQLKKKLSQPESPNPDDLNFNKCVPDVTHNECLVRENDGIDLEEGLKKIKECRECCRDLCTARAGGYIKSTQNPSATLSTPRYKC